VKYAFIRDQGRPFKLARLCAALGVSRSGYYEWLGRPESKRAMENRLLLERIRTLHRQAREAYGAYKTWRVLRARGIAGGKHRVARLRRQNGIESLRKRRFRVTVEHHKRAAAAPNTLARQFTVSLPDRIWAGDTTVIPVAIPGHTAGSMGFIFPVKDGSRTHTAALFGGSILNPQRRFPASLFQQYLGSIRHFADVTKTHRVDVELLNHPIMDGLFERLDRLKVRKSGEPHPLVIGEASYQRFVGVMAKCAEAQLARRQAP
jgi:hypothetical protein